MDYSDKYIALLEEDNEKTKEAEIKRESKKGYG